MNLALLPAPTDERRVVDVISARSCVSPAVVVRSWTQRCRHEHEWICPLCLEGGDECMCGRGVES